MGVTLSLTSSTPPPDKEVQLPSLPAQPSGASLDLSSLAHALPTEDSAREDWRSSQDSDYPLPIVTHLTLQAGTLESYRPSVLQIRRLKHDTQNQSDCDLWFKHRAGRITASKAHDVMVIRPSTDPSNLVRRILRPYEGLGNIPQIKWGTDNEETARNVYEKQQKSKHQQFTCDKSGFLIDVDRPFLGASSDGEVNCSCCGKGVLEIKCPYKHRDATIQEALADPHFCLNAVRRLKRSHRYFTQVQFQMHIHRVGYCDFFVYTRRDSHCHRVEYDEDFCEDLMEKSERFFEENVLTAILQNGSGEAVTTGTGS